MNTNKESNQDWYVHIPHWIATLDNRDWVDKVILSIIYSLQANFKSFYMSNSTLAARACIDVRSLQRRLQKLESARLIKKTQGKSGRYLQVIAPNSPISNGDVVVEKPDSDRGVTPTVQGCHSNRAGVSPEPSNNKVNNKVNNKKDLKPIDHSSNDRGKGYTEGFERFWSNYPKRVAKADAFKAFKAKAKERSVKHEEFAAFLTNHLEQRCKTEWKGKERQYIPNASSFLRQERWDDDLSYTNDIATDKPAAYTNRFRTHLYDNHPAKVPGLDNMEPNAYEHE